jgi:poly(3-hydroxybutyrate) depolymerase
MNGRADRWTVQRRREALLADLRAVHRRDRAPLALRQQVLARFAPERPRPAWGMPAWARWLSSARDQAGMLPSAALSLASCVVLALVASRLLSGLSAPLSISESQDSAGERPSLAVGPEPKAEGQKTLGSNPSIDPQLDDGSRRRIAPERACPLFEVPSGAMIAAGKTDADSSVSGLTLHTFTTETQSCGPLERRYLVLEPALASRSNAPVLIVLHDTGRSGELMRVDSRWRFEELAKREGFILVYANAAPGPATAVRSGNSGGWQTDSRTHPEVDDEEYLERIISDLVVRHVIAGDNDVYLVGYVGGAMMALTAAARHPYAYVGVAAILPPKPESVEPPVLKQGPGLSRAFFVLDQKATLDDPPRDLARRWAGAFGIRRTKFQSYRLPGTRAATRVEQLDAAQPASGSAAVRLLVVTGPFDPFAAVSRPGTSAPEASPPSPTSPSGSIVRDFDGARDTWAFLSGADGIAPLELDPDEPNPSPRHGEDIRLEDTGFEDPELLIDELLVRAPEKARRRAAPAP